MFLSHRARKLAAQLHATPIHFTTAVRFRHKLTENGASEIPLYLAALDLCDPAAPSDPFAVSPYHLLTDVLAELAAPQLIPIALRDFERAHNRAHLARAVAAIGHDDAIAPCLRWLESADTSLHKAVADGAAAAARSGRATRPFRQAIFHALAAAITPPGANAATKETCTALLALDHAATLALLTPTLTAANPNLPVLLDVLAQAGAPLDPNTTLALLHGARCAPVTAAAEAHTRTTIQRACLKLLAETAPHLIRDELEAALSDRDLRSTAVELITTIENLTPIYRNYTEAIYNTWPREQQLVADITAMKLQIESNGLTALWINHDPLYYRSLLPKLREIGADATAATLESAAVILGINDASIASAPPDESLPDSDDLERTLQELLVSTPQFEELEVLLLTYMRTHRDRFRSLD